MAYYPYTPTMKQRRKNLQDFREGYAIPCAFSSVRDVVDMVHRLLARAPQRGTIAGELDAGYAAARIALAVGVNLLPLEE